MRVLRPTACCCSLLAIFALLTGCDPSRPAGRSSQPQTTTDPDAPRPNVLLIVWDTVRSDHLTPYGYARPTTPALAEWARDARIYEDCLTPGIPTVPAHASLFSGLSAVEHGAYNDLPTLSDALPMLAESLRGAGYATLLFSANPHVSAENNFHRGFDVHEHPWSRTFMQRALEIARQKLNPADRSTELAGRMRTGQLGPWHVKAAGELAQQCVTDWLAAKPADKPFFIFLNYMEAHRPLIPAERFRQRFMTPEQVAASYRVDRTWVSLWSYNFRLREYSDEEIELTRATYDAALAELDELFASLLAALRERGELDDTLVILTSDHGEHLGEHHMLDHQFSVYNELARVPLIVHYPARFAAGRDAAPVILTDLHSTILRLAGAPYRAESPSLLAPPPAPRMRIVSYPAPLLDAMERVRKVHPGFDPTPWQRRLHAIYLDNLKYIWGSDGRAELYDLAADPREQRDLRAERPADAQRLHEALRAHFRSLRPPPPPVTAASRSLEQQRMIEGMGYAAKPGEALSDNEAGTDIGPYKP